MEITNIEARTFELMMARFEHFADKVDALCRANEDKSLHKWLDNQEVCEILHVSKRTLQYYRESGIIAFSQINYKMFYHPKDVQALIDKLKKR